MAILSARDSAIVEHRARELGITRVLQGRGDKATAFRELLVETRLDADDAAFVGDDLPDLPVLRRPASPTTVDDARDEVKRAAHWIAPLAGGRAAVRAFAEFILRAKGIDFAEMVHG